MRKAPKGLVCSVVQWGYPHTCLQCQQPRRLRGFTPSRTSAGPSLTHTHVLDPHAGQYGATFGALRTFGGLLGSGLSMTSFMRPL